jgi:hypothetical protein
VRIDMTTREWHELVKPVLPHILKDPDFPELSHIRIEVGARSLYAVATDRYTLGAERRPLGRADRNSPMPPVHIQAPDIAASLKLFTYSKDNDPDLSVTVDTVIIPSEVMGQDGSYSSLAVTVTSDTGSKMVMHDRRMAHRDPHANWRRHVSAAIDRAQGGTPAGLDLSPDHLGRWSAAVRAGERLTVWTGPERRSHILVTVDEHFAGVWTPYAWGDAETAPRAPSALPWSAELWVDPETGEMLDG